MGIVLYIQIVHYFNRRHAPKLFMYIYTVASYLVLFRLSVNKKKLYTSWVQKKLYTSWVQTVADFFFFCMIRDFFSPLKPIMAQAFVKLSKGDKADEYYKYIATYFLLFVGTSLPSRITGFSFCMHMMLIQYILGQWIRISEIVAWVRFFFYLTHVIFT